MNHGSYDCPFGFNEYKFGRILTPETKSGANLYFCLKWNKFMKNIKTIIY